MRLVPFVASAVLAYTLVPSARADCTPGGLATLAARGLVPAFDPSVREYRIPRPPGGSLELITRPCATSVEVYARSTRQTPNRITPVWAGDGAPVDVVLYERWREVGRYTLRIDDSLPPPPPVPVVRSIAASDLSPAYAPHITRYTVPSELEVPGERTFSAGVVPVVVTVGDPFVDDPFVDDPFVGDPFSPTQPVTVMVNGTLVTPGEVFDAWAPPGGHVDVVAYRNWVELARYRLDVTAADIEPPNPDVDPPDPDVDPPDPDLQVIPAEYREALRRLLASDPEAAAAYAAFEAGPAEDKVPGQKTLNFRGHDGVMTSVEVATALMGWIEVARSAAASEDPATLLARYTLVELALTRALGRSPITPSAALSTASVTELRAALREARPLLASALRGAETQNMGRSTPLINPDAPGPVTLPGQDVLEGRVCVGGRPADVGDGDGGDLAALGLSASQCTLFPGGIVGNDTRPYVERLGCVRHQGNRGTCAAFAIASALEMAHAVEYDVLPNLSEQTIYYEAKRHDGDKGDGLYAGASLEHLATLDSLLPVESEWSYNPSPKRSAVTCQGVMCYEESCAGYDEACSDTAHQGQRVCTSHDHSLFCHWEAAATSGGVALNGSSPELWDPYDTEGSVLLLKAALSVDWQVVLSINANTAFTDAVEADGYLDYEGSDVWSGSGHALHVVAYIDNSELEALVPGAPPGDYAKPGYGEGEGGYFVLRNSWGPCAGDGGYVYASYRWMRPVNFVYGARVFNSINVSQL
ncbi:MAG: hypothetical protein IV100_16085 [Myxococcales bacterium]|nr:hypothetical protein [Myxococcales bacterium]